ncbi:hypothetical protein [Noviherbaspirillum saxi]|uniref:hypothetical protein n=1 Tax=Noviherbaspirillum saxi TaxID=2320863 RepID=UPI0011C44F21|nr:hypothetical protein [Noviherbaspirillum saxi]
MGWQKKRKSWNNWPEKTTSQLKTFSMISTSLNGLDGSSEAFQEDPRLNTTMLWLTKPVIGHEASVSSFTNWSHNQFIDVSLPSLFLLAPR